MATKGPCPKQPQGHRAMGPGARTPKPKALPASLTSPVTPELSFLTQFPKLRTSVGARWGCVQTASTPRDLPLAAPPSGQRPGSQGGLRMLAPGSRTPASSGTVEPMGWVHSLGPQGREGRRTKRPGWLLSQPTWGDLSGGRSLWEQPPGLGCGLGYSSRRHRPSGPQDGLGVPSPPAAPRPHCQESLLRAPGPLGKARPR